ncbi:hypothetical protein OC25_10215 [Pedobacter kyungheensis]|uniref:Uncharacterized protein n=2 Tax=Pedobacter kyungheensis TaxID=1069985 RepID=A0A0C1FR97_9SPHI|nr:hypothetical protein OC25_10215 [Pedobacter kyungheensis]
MSAKHQQKSNLLPDEGFYIHIFNVKIMKTSIYNKAEHLEGYIGKEGNSEEKSEVQKAYEAGNEGNEVTSFGRDTIAKYNAETMHLDKTTPRDGLDNTGTQGADSLSDDAYNSADKHPTLKSAESHTGSSSDDFKTKTGINEADEDHALDTGI